MISPVLMFSTHIVGGTLNYVHNGGSSYTVTFKLFRDCSSGTASFPGTVTISVRGLNGAAFTPSKDFVMSLGPVTNVPSTLPPCATQPNPLPCTQQGIYTTTVTNLPSVPGGYHLYYQLEARNLTLTNVNASGNNVGSSFYAFIPEQTVVYNEDFTLANGTTVDNGATAWSIANGVPAPASASVNANLFRTTGADNGTVTWTSQLINISTLGRTAVAVALTENGTLENNDSIKVFYSLNGGPLTQFALNGSMVDDFNGGATATQNNLIGNTLQIVIRVRYGGSSPSSEEYNWDNVYVSGSNSNPTFTLFPPLFLCLNTPFTFNHAATDVDGDSLVYELYAPYNGDNASPGGLDPTFPGNTATFTPITFLGGYSTLQPLGGSSLTLNSSTGLLTGTPPALGQYVVGILVKEYRNGVYLSSTLRDFQFNVVNCPQTLGVAIGPQNPTICFGSTSTTLTANGSGGQPPYTYLWNGSVPTQTITVGVGTYSVTITDNSGCQSFAFVTVTAFTAAIDANTGPNRNVCRTLPSQATAITGTVTGTSTGIWTGGGGTYSPNTTTLVNMVYTPSAAELTAGFANLILTTTGNGTCPLDDDTIRINYIPFTGTVTPTATPVNCFGGTNGGAAVTVAGGQSPYTYSWNTSPAQTTPTVSNLSPGTYSVTITDAIGCTQQTPVTVAQPPILAATATGSIASCSGGSITAGASGGTGPYTYLWAPGGQTTATATGLTTGSYTVTVTDSKGCTATASTSVTPPAAMSVSVAGTSPNCFSGANGSATATITGGLGPFTYNWTPSGGTAATANGLAAGNYTVTVTDSRTCSATGTVTITQPTQLTASATATNETCDYSNNGTATATAGAGTPGYTYLWAPGGQTTVTATALAAGNYTVTVTDSKGCTRQAFASVTQPATLAATLGSQTNVNCNGGNNGSVTASGTGGTPGYTYLWAPGGQTSATATSLASGTYTVTVTDTRSCTGQATVTITQPTLALSATTTFTNVACNGGNTGTITAAPTGGTAPYSYLWAPGGQTTATVNNLIAGSYTVTVTDSRGCTTTATRTLTQPTALNVSLAGTDVNCFGGSNGAITSTVTGGTPAYSYTWTPGGATSSNVTGLIAGTYTVSVRDNQNCTRTASLTITQPTTITVSATPTAETCDYSNNGSVTAAPSGGTPGYTYLWAPGGQTTITATGLAAGNYTVTVTDSKGCIKTANAAVTQPAVLSMTFGGQTNVSCLGGNNGSVTATGTGGTPNYTYSWMPGSLSGASVTGLAAGTYTVNITDSHACTGQNTVTITQPTLALSATTTFTNVACFGGSSGTITATPVGGTAPYSFLWAPGGQTTATVNSLVAGTYTVTVTDSKGCTTTSTRTLTQPTALNVSLTGTDPSCFGGTNGSITSTVTGGTTAYSYTWTPGGATSGNVTGLVAGSYTLSVRDNQNCTQTASVTITQPSTITVTATPTGESCDYSNNGSAAAVAAGGTPGYTYLWQPGNQTTATATGLAAGNYTVTVTDSKGCIRTQTAAVTQPALLSMTFSGQTNVSCNGGNNGSVTAVGTGGTPNYSYTWMPGALSGASVTGLAAGTYTVNISDANACAGQGTVTITQPTLALSTSTTFTNVSCFGGNNGTITATPSGGTAPYSFVWAPGGQTTATITTLVAGTYTVTVTDSKGCTTTATRTITQPAVLNVSLVGTDVSCFGGSNGTITSTVTGGTAAYSYTWTPGGSTASNVSGLAAGSYTVSVRDNLNCTQTASLTITQPITLTVTTTPTAETCDYSNDGSISSAVTGGTPAYTYLWAPGGQTTAIATNLTSGSYTLTVTDSKGCVRAAVTNVTQPAPVSTSFGSQTNVSCFGGNTGSVAVTGVGGTPNYSYSWMPGSLSGSTAMGLAAGTYTVTVTDAHMCTGLGTVTITQPAAMLTVSGTSTPVSCFEGTNGTVSANGAGGTTPYVNYTWMPGNLVGQNISNLPADSYTVTVTDNNNCTASNTIVVTEPAAMVATMGSISSTCSGTNGFASTSVSGGAGGYTYQWFPSGGTGSTTIPIGSGAYTVQVTDANGCTVQNSVNVNDNTGPSASIFATTNVTCNGGSDGTATVGVVGGFGTLTYNWTPTGGNGPVATGLVAGTYTISVIDQNGCESLATTSPPVSEPPAIVIGISTVPATCFGSANGSASAVATGGTGALSYLWLPGNTTGSTVSGLAAGIYTLQVTDANSCVKTATFSITQPASSLSVSASATNVSCFGGSNGTASSTVSGGTAPYAFTWMPGSLSGQNVSNLTAANYTINVTDFKGCTTSNSISVTQPAAVSLATGSTNSTCNNPNGSAFVNASGGTGGYTYSWSPGGQITSIISSVAPGTYTVLVNDANSCPATAMVTINNTGGPVVTVDATNNPTCNGAANGTAVTSVTGGTGAISYSWAPSGGTGSIGNNLSTGIYTVTATDQNGCQSQATTTMMTEPAPLFISLATIPVTCFGGGSGTVSSTVAGGTPGYTYFWLPGGATSATVNGLNADTYTLQVTDANTCISSQTIVVTQPSAALSVSATSTNVSCFGGSDGTASSVVSGGTTPYTFEWMPGTISGQDISNLIAGTYTINITDFNGCTTANSISVTQPGAVALTTSSSNSTCGNPNGSATVNATGGTGAYTYFWSPGGQATNTINGIEPGTYTVLVNDANSCPATAMVTVSNTGGPVVTVDATNNPTCNGAANGTAVTSITGGTGIITYSWTPSGGTGSVGNNLSTGVYTVTATDQNGCQSQATTTMMTEPAPLFIDLTSTAVTCFGIGNGTAASTVAGGTPGYNFLWLPGGQTSGTVNGLIAGTYTLQITDANTCIASQTVEVIQPASSLSVSASSTNVSCFGGADGTASSVVSGGTGPYTYEWMPGTISGQDIANLVIGTYTINVTDFNGCTATNSVTITQPSAVSLTSGSTNSTCGDPNGTASVSASGGTGAYTYFWSPGSQATASISGVTSGSYTVLVNDANNCSATTTVTISNTAGPVVTVTGITDVTCNGAADGTATTSITGGTGTINYSWAPSGGTAATGTGLAPGIYTVTATDANSCESAATTTVITEPPAISVNVTTTVVACFGGNTGTASAAAAGGTTPYTYLWLPGGATGATVSGLSANTYTVRATDGNGCILNQPFTITEPSAALAVNITTTAVSCFGGGDGTATANVSGGTAPYDYSWAPVAGNSVTLINLSAGNHTVTVTDDQGCVSSSTITVSEPAAALTATGSSSTVNCFNGTDGTALVTPAGGTPNYSYQWSPSGGTAQTASGLSSGIYVVTVTDAKSCSTSVSIDVVQPEDLTGTLPAIDATCGLANGSIGSQITGGTVPYAYSWSPGGAITPAINGLNAGSYTLVVTDAHNCVATFSTSITNTLPVLATVTANNPALCFGTATGSATINITQGTAPYTINWLPFGGTAATATGLSAGTYTATIMDSIGCTDSITTATITEPTQLSVSIDSITNVLCNGQANGTITVVPSGATPNYTYAWAPVASSLPTVSGVAAGTYSVTVTDQNSCSLTVSMTVTEPAVLSSAVSSTINPLCFGELGSTSVTVSGGTIPYAYNWTSSPPQSGSTMEDEPAGTYTCTITDLNGCTIISTATITEPTQVVTLAGPDAIMCLGNPGSLTASATGGTGTYSYVWMTPPTLTSGTLPLNLTVTETYTVTAFDQNNCAGIPDTVIANVYDLNQSSILATGDSLICPGGTAAVFVQVNSINTGPLTYSWTNLSGTGPGAYLVTPGVPTTYVVTVSNPCGSVIKDSITVSFNPPPTIVLLADTNKICAPDSIHFTDASITGNVNDPINSWFWNFGDGTTSTLENPSHQYQNPGSYNVSVVVQTQGGCINNNATAPFNIQAYSYPTAAFSVNSSSLTLPYDQLICTNQSSPTLGTTYVWDFGDGTQSTLTNPHHSYNAIGNFNVQLVAISSHGCPDTVSHELVTDADVQFPNVFSPNPDGPSGGSYNPFDLSNDVFFPFASGVIDYKMQIFNRWGELIFESTDVKIGWDGYYRGKLCPQDVYIYKAYLKLNNGKEYDKTGDITLLQ
jgi:gliding motility-associated-like protein